MTLHLSADTGCVRIETLPPGAPPLVHYAVHVETDAPGPLGTRYLDLYSVTARQTTDSVFLSGSLPSPRQLLGSHFPNPRNFQSWVQFVVSIPATFSVEISTGAGDIETDDIGGRAVLETQGGNIHTGRIGRSGTPQITLGDRPVAKITTQGGHITLLDISGDLDAYTTGGHIRVGNVSGNARLRTGGGHIRAGQIGGTAQLETDGGNVAVGQAGSFVTVRTGGGQIDFGEVHGSVRAQTGGGGIRMMYVAGPVEVVTNGGSICLTRVANTIHAATSEGSITAWITPETPAAHGTLRLPGPSQLASRTGDLAVFLPRNIALTIDAVVENGGPSRIETDPGFPLNIQRDPEGLVHAIGIVNGGGTTLKLRTVGGRIQLHYLDEQLSLRQSLLEEQRQRLSERSIDFSTASAPGRPTPGSLEPAPEESNEPWFDNAKNRLQFLLLGSVREDEKDFKKRLVVAPPPDYPPLARRAGLQGVVQLQVRLRTDGALTVDRVLEGEPALADAATAAVRQWRARPEQIGGRPVEVVSTLSFNFQLQ